MRFIAEMLDKSDTINHLVEFGFEDTQIIYVGDDVMYVDGVPVVLSSVRLALNDDQLSALDAQAAEIERLRTENADQATRIDDLKSEIRGLERGIGRLENMPAPSLTTAEVIRLLTTSGYLIVEPRDMESFRYIGGACPLCGQAHP